MGDTKKILKNKEVNWESFRTLGHSEGSRPKQSHPPSYLVYTRRSLRYSQVSSSKGNSRPSPLVFTFSSWTQMSFSYVFPLLYSWKTLKNWPRHTAQWLQHSPVIQVTSIVWPQDTGIHVRSLQRQEEGWEESRNSLLLLPLQRSVSFHNHENLFFVFRFTSGSGSSCWGCF